MRSLSTLVVFGRRGLICALLVGLTSGLAVAEVQLRFAPQAGYPAGNVPYSIAVGDFDGDGRQDLAVANYGSADVSVLLGNGDGGFATQTRFPIGGSPVDIVVADFDRDGHQDLVVLNAVGTAGMGEVSVMLGNGYGSFAPPIRSAQLTGSISFAIGDFDGDGLKDLAVVGYWWWDPWGIEGYGEICLLYGTGDGGFSFHEYYCYGEDNEYPQTVAVGDFDGNGHQDLAVGFMAAYVSVMLGPLDFWATETRYPVGHWSSSVAIGNFNADGHQDLVTANWDASDVSVLLGNGDGSFGNQTRYPAGRRPNSVAIGDFDGDGHQDLAVANSNDISVLLGNGDGSFAPQTGYPAGNQPYSIAVGDFDGNGRQDLAVGNSGSDDVSVLLNRSYVPVQIDFRSNSINSSRRGVVPIAIFGSEEFDVTQIDVTSLRFGPNEAECAHDLNDPFDYNEHVEDMNLDGYMDLMTHYRVEEMGIACGDTEVTLAGQTLSGQFFEGTDSIRTVGCTSSRPVNRRQPQQLRLDDRQRPSGPVKPKKEVE